MSIELEKVCISLGEFNLESISLKVNQGEYLTIIGPTGSGKSIILETIAGFYKPASGKIKVNGQDVTHLPPEKRNISIVYQDYVLFPHMNVYENIAYGLKKRFNSQKDLKAKVEEIAELLNISHLLSRYPSTLSGGESQRVALARALVVNPKVLLLDEPLSALDPLTRENTRKLIKCVVTQLKTTTIHVTHDFEDVRVLANKVAVIKNGKVLQVGTPEEILLNPANEAVAELVRAGISSLKTSG